MERCLPRDYGRRHRERHRVLWSCSRAGSLQRSVRPHHLTCHLCFSPDPLTRAHLDYSWAAFSPEIVEKNHQAAYIQDPGKVGGETKQAQDTWLAEACWELSERIIREKVGEDALGSWSA